MTDTPIIDTKVLAQQFKEQAIPLKCPACQKVYKSLAGVLYHIGQFRGNTKVPRCMLGEDTPKGSPGRTPGSPMSAHKRKTPKREALTWAESQRLVEFELNYEYHRLEIDEDVQLVSEGEDNNSDKEDKCSKYQTPNRKVRANANQSRSTSKIKCKKRSKLKGTNDNFMNQNVKLPEATFTTIESMDFTDAPVRDQVYYRFIEQSAEELDEMIEYDMDEEDYQWLTLINEERKNDGLTSVPQEVFELLMDRFEKECIFESQVTGNDGEAINPYNIDENAVCCICNDGECHNTNAILFCDMCNLAVHQECYGVPYIPEGQWLCRRCLQSPSRSVDCVLCPNKGGAFKQTVDGRWAHVICSLWIPEVQFANPVFLEPIDGIQDVPSARWKLLCYICRKRSGACIQCAKANCYVAFHVTCAQQAGLYMKIEMGKNSDICKTAFCDSHTPPAARKKLMETIKSSDSGDDIDKDIEEEVRSTASEPVVDSEEQPEMYKRGKSESKVVKRARKILEEQQRSSQAPVVNIPYIPQNRLDRIISRVSLHKKSQFIPKLVSYWKLKRQSRNGVPFLRRLQASNNKGQKTTLVRNLSEEERETLLEQLSLWKALRHDLERARLLIELVRKREKLKREQLRMYEEISRLRLTPLEVIMKRLLLKLSAKDPADIFAEPVPLEDVPDYLDIVKKPMDLGTMKRKLETHQYIKLSDFEKDLQLVWNNAMLYNQKDTIYYRAAVRIRDAGKRILEQAHQQIESAGISKVSGMHEPDVEEPPPLTPNAAAIIQRQPLDMFTKEGEYAEVKQVKKPHERHNSTTLDEQVEYLEEQLSVLESQCKGSTRKKENKLRKELCSLKRQIKNRDKVNDPNFTVSPPISSNTGSSRRKATPQDAEGLASQLLHGSLRLTVCRRAILSSSGIKLDERVKNNQNELQENEEDEEKEEPMVDNITEEKGNEDDDANGVEQESKDEGESKITRRTNQRTSSNDKPTRGVTWKDNYLSSQKPKRRPRRRNKSYPMAFERRKRERKYRARLFSETSNSAEECDTSTDMRTQSRQSSSSLEDPEEFNRIIRSPSFEEMIDNTQQIPVAATVDDLTISNSYSLIRKRKNSVDTDSDTPVSKRKRTTKSTTSSSAKITNKGLNGLSNGLQDVIPQPLELVWAKCRGYPPYPALIIDPNMPSDGMKVNGEFIQAPSEEVLEHRDKNPLNTILVRFFDGRRTWQWLHPTKLDYLGVNKDFDHVQINNSGASKRSVQQAYERAMRYQQKVLQSNVDDSDDDCSSSTTT